MKINEFSDFKDKAARQATANNRMVADIFFGYDATPEDEANAKMIAGGKNENR